MKIAMQLASSVHHLRSTGFRDYTPALRLYDQSPEVAQGAWQPPPINRVD